MTSDIVVAQGLSCDAMEPFCAGDDSLIFENTAGVGNAENGPDYGCLGSEPNPAWYFIQVDQSGDLFFRIEQNTLQDFTGAGLDVDFVAWGPFTSTEIQSGICNDLTAANHVPGSWSGGDPPINNSTSQGCSYSGFEIESFNIIGATAGEFYVLLITNFSNTPGFIRMEQSNAGAQDSGTTDCSIVNSFSYCEGEVVSLDATTPAAVTYEWFRDGIPLAQTGSILNGITAPNAVYTCNALNSTNGIISSYEFNVNFLEQPTANAIDDILICDDNNDGLYDFNFSNSTTQIIDAQDSNLFSVSYYTSQGDADARINELTQPHQNTANPQTIYARIENITKIDCYATTTFSIEVFDQPLANTIPDQLVCDDNNDGAWEFNLTDFDNLVLDTQGSAQFAVSYHDSQSDADNNVNPLVSPYTNGMNPETIYVRIHNVDNNLCYDTSEFTIQVYNQPVLSTVSNQLICDDNNDGLWALDLSTLTTIALGTQNSSDFSVTYHLSQADANANSGALTDPYTNATAYSEEEIFIRIENNLNSECFESNSFIFDVFDQPTASAIDFNSCDNLDDGDEANGFVEFDLATIIADVLGTQDPTQFNVSFYLNQSDANNALASIPLNFTNSTINNQQIIARVENIDQTNCYETAIVNLIVDLVPVVNSLVELFQCDDDTDGIVSFNLTEANELISANYSNETITYYTDATDAENGINAIANPITFLNSEPSAAPDILFVRTENAAGCYKTSQLNLIVSTTQVPSNFMLNYEECDTLVEDNDDQNGITNFDFGDANAQILSLFPIGQVLTVTYYENQSDALAETNAITDISNYRNDSSPFVQNIYVRVDSDIDNACLGLGHYITLTVNPVPEVIPVSDYIVCEDNSDDIYDFDLESKNQEILNGQDSSIFLVTYHESQIESDNGANPLASPYTNSVNLQVIYVRITNMITGCSKSVIDFILEVQEEVQANQNMPPFILCDLDAPNDGFTSFDLRSQDLAILDGQNPLLYEVNYYLTLTDANMAINELPDTYVNVENPQIIYARVNDISIPNSICWATTMLTLEVDLLPIFDLDDEYLLCINTNGTEEVGIPILDTELSETDYTFEWSLNGSVLPLETGSSLIPLQGGSYSVVVTNNFTGCQNSDSTLVNESEPPIISAEVTTPIFADNHVIEVTALGLGVYEYSLDNGLWQSSNIFEGVMAGEHVIVVRDKNGCGWASVTVLVIDYPLYFTPNGDGYHDTWNIVGIGTQPSAKIFIYDRFGKLLKQLSPTGIGWNGTYNGAELPASDYWFVVEYNEPLDNLRREFRAHFTLKR